MGSDATAKEAPAHGGMSHDYPDRILLDPNKKFRPAALRAIKAFSKEKPWRGTLAERQAKYRALHCALVLAYGIEPTELVFENDESRDSGSSCFVPATRRIILRGRLSVVTYLHELGHCLWGRSEEKACRWSISAFYRCFPRSFARCRHDGHMLRAGRAGDAGSHTASRPLPEKSKRQLKERSHR